MRPGPVASGVICRANMARGGRCASRCGAGWRPGFFESLVADVQPIVRAWSGRKGQPAAVCVDSRTLQSTPESGSRAGYDGAKRSKGSKVHLAVDTLGHLLALTVTPADEGDRGQVAPLAEQIQQVAGNSVELA